MWRSIVSNRWRVTQDFSASSNNSLSSVVCNSSAPLSNGLKGAKLTLGMKLFMGRPSLRPIPRALMMHSCLKFYKCLLVVSATHAAAHLANENKNKSREHSDGVPQLQSSPYRSPFASLSRRTKHEVGLSF